MADYGLPTKQYCGASNGRSPRGYQSVRYRRRAQIKLANALSPCTLMKTVDVVKQLIPGATPDQPCVIGAARI